MKEKVFADDFTKNFYSQSEFLDFLTEREKNSYWSRIRAKDLKFYAMEKEMKLHKDLKMNMLYKVKKMFSLTQLKTQD